MSPTFASTAKFQSARLRPALDLLKRATEFVPDCGAVKSVLDLGCGQGSATPYLCSAFPAATVVGVDKNASFVQKAIANNCKSENGGRISYAVQPIEDTILTASALFDVVFSHSALHWCAHHETFFPKLLKRLVASNGGVLAIQMPDTRVQPSHLLMETAALRTGMLNHLKEVRIPRVEKDPHWYFDVLSPYVKEIDMWSTEYVQQLESTYDQSFSSDDHPVLEYSKGAGLLPVMAALGGEHSEKCQRYLKEYNRLLHDQYPTVCVKNSYHMQGKLVTLMPFKRFFIVCKT